MAQYDYYPLHDAPGYWLDCQTDLMDAYATRFVVPLLPFATVPGPARHLNPVFDIDGVQHTMATQYAAAIPARELQAKAGSLARSRYDVVKALDFLISGI